MSLFTSIFQLFVYKNRISHHSLKIHLNLLMKYAYSSKYQVAISQILLYKITLENYYQDYLKDQHYKLIDYIDYNVLLIE